MTSFPYALGFILTLCVTGGTFPAGAQDYPTKPIRIVSGPQTGTSGDVSGRLVAHKMSISMGQPVVFESRPGANGTLAANYAKTQPADGYTLLYISSGTAVTARFLMKDVTLDVAKELAPISLFVMAPSFLAVNGAVPADSVAGFIDYAKRNPGKLAYGSPGVGSTFHLIGEALKMATGIDMLHVPYSGGNISSAVTDLVNDRIQVFFPSLTTVGAYLGTDKIKLLGVFGTVRYKRMPDIPTVNETLPANKVVPSWFAFFGPLGIPTPIAERLHVEIKKALDDAEVIAKLDGLGISPVASSPAELASAIRTGTDDMADLVKALGIVPN